MLSAFFDHKKHQTFRLIFKILFCISGFSVFYHYYQSLSNRKIYHLQQKSIQYRKALKTSLLHHKRDLWRYSVPLLDVPIQAKPMEKQKTVFILLMKGCAASHRLLDHILRYSEAERKHLPLHSIKTFLDASSWSENPLPIEMRPLPSEGSCKPLRFRFVIMPAISRDIDWCCAFNFATRWGFLKDFLKMFPFHETHPQDALLHFLVKNMPSDFWKRREFQSRDSLLKSPRHHLFARTWKNERMKIQQAFTLQSPIFSQLPLMFLETSCKNIPEDNRLFIGSSQHYMPFSRLMSRWEF